MLDAFLGHYAYWAAIALLAIGLYIVTAGMNLVKKVMGLSIFQSAVFVLYISIGAVENATAPIVDPAHGAYANPLTHVLILTAIVVGVATAALALALVVRIHAECGSIEEDDIERALLATGPGWSEVVVGGVAAHDDALPAMRISGPSGARAGTGGADGGGDGGEGRGGMDRPEDGDR